jgi:hypothetical protein
VAEQLAEVGYRISQTTLKRLLEEMKYSLKANVKRLAGSSHPDRERQFEYIASQRHSFEANGMPVISVDTKKKELIGNFKNPGQTWRQIADAVNDHDFEHDALGKAVPYGIYDLKHNRGYVYVGQSADTPQFAVDNIVRWWTEEGQFLYPHANKLLILADAGLRAAAGRRAAESSGACFGAHRIIHRPATNWQRPALCPRGVYRARLARGGRCALARPSDRRGERGTADVRRGGGGGRVHRRAAAGGAAANRFALSQACHATTGGIP